MNTFTAAKPQTKSNARRSADAATKRTGAQHEIFEVEGGWAFRPAKNADATITWDEPAPAAAGPQTAPKPPQDYKDGVQALLTAQGYITDLLDKPDAAQELEIAFEAGFTIGEAASAIASWADEQTEDEFQAAVKDDEQSPEAIARRQAERAAAREVEAAEAAAETAEAEAAEAEAAEAEAAEAEVGAEPEPSAEAAPAKQAPRGLRAAVATFLAAWDADEGGSDTQKALLEAVDALRAAATGGGDRPARPATGGMPKEGTKGAQVIERLRQPEGASGPDLMALTGWQSHTLRGFFAGLRKRGTPVEALRRVTKADGGGQAFTVYRIPTEASAPAAD